jgi:hypothetical protein
MTKYGDNWGCPVPQAIDTVAIKLPTGRYFCPYCEVFLPKKYLDKHTTCNYSYPKGLAEDVKSRNKYKERDWVQANRNKGSV